MIKNYILLTALCVLITPISAQDLTPQAKGVWSISGNFGMGQYHHWSETSGVKSRAQPIQLGLALRFQLAKNYPVFDLSFNQNRYTGYAGTASTGYTFGMINCSYFEATAGYNLMQNSEKFKFIPALGIGMVSVNSEKEHDHNNATVASDLISETYYGKHVSIPLILSLERKITDQLHFGIFGKMQFVSADVWMYSNHYKWNRFSSGGMLVRWYLGKN